MSLKPWLQSLRNKVVTSLPGHDGRRRSSQRGSRRQRRLEVEALESRLAPATVTWNIAGSGAWNVAGNWDNTGVSDTLEVGNLATLPFSPGFGFDQLNVSSAFTHGGAVKIDVSSYVAGSGYVADLKLLGWGSEVGSSASTIVSFVGGPALPYQFRTDGLYLTNVSYSIPPVPEPASLAIAVTGLVFCLAIRRKVR